MPMKPEMMDAAPVEEKPQDPLLSVLAEIREVLDRAEQDHVGAAMEKRKAPKAPAVPPVEG